MKIKSDLGVLIDQLKVRSGPCRAKLYDFWRRAVVIALIDWQRRILAIKRAWRRGAINATQSIPGRIDFHVWIHLQDIGQSSHVIPVAVRQDDEIQLREINPYDLRVARKNVRIAACIEQNALAPYSRSAA